MPGPQSFVSQNVGMTKITVSYSSPGMKGRKIFGELVPYGKEWRAGANSPTMLSFSTDVSVAGKTLRAGKYVVRMIPNKEGNWIVKLNLTNLEIGLQDCGRKELWVFHTTTTKTEKST